MAVTWTLVNLACELIARAFPGRVVRVRFEDLCLRHASHVRFDPGGGPPRPPLPRWLSAVSIVLCGPLMWRYGYRLGHGHPRPARAKPVQSA
jgi:hypothetical protein